MRGRASGRSCGRDFGWAQAKEQLAAGVSPKVVAARLGMPEQHVLNTAKIQGWPVAYRAAPTPDDIIDAAKRAILA